MATFNMSDQSDIGNLRAMAREAGGDWVGSSDPDTDWASVDLAQTAAETWGVIVRDWQCQCDHTPAERRAGLACELVSAEEADQARAKYIDSFVAGARAGRAWVA